MKHLLLILISFLLLSSPVIGNSHKGETLYGWDNPSGDGWLWKGYGDKENHTIYKGEVENGVPNGLGVLISPYGYKYVGSWKDGKMNGQGTDTFPESGKYVGSWKNGKQNGKGTMTYPNIGKYVGSWKNGEWWNGTFYDKDGKKPLVNGK